MRVAIVHPWFPQYRVEFFEELRRRALAEGITVDIFHGSPPPEWNERGDSVVRDYAIALPTRFIRVGGRSFVMKGTAPLQKRAPYDLIILEQAVRNLETYLLLLRYPKNVAFWGHGRSYTKQVGQSQESLKSWITRRGRWFFGYTQGGVEATIAGGFPSGKTTVVQNSIDTSSLASAVDGVSADQLAVFRRKHGVSGPTGLFIGGLDESKRISFLLEAADQVHRHHPRFKLLIGGNGESRAIVERAAAEREWVTYLGGLHGGEKAVALRAADLIMMPGRVGLVAVDSFAAGTPIATTRWRWHAPEFEYLTNGDNALITEDNVAAYARDVSELLDDQNRLRMLSRNALVLRDTYTVSAMTENFLGGLRAAGHTMRGRS